MTNSEDFTMVARLSAELQIEMLDETSDVWAASPFAWIREQPSARKGAIGVAIVRAWSSSVGFDVTRATHTDHDLVISGLKIEVKLSTLWASGIFKFQQLRDQDYEHVCLLGLEPQEVRLWTLPKAVALDRARGQHTGDKGTETSWLSFKATSPDPWLAPYGGTFAAARTYLEQAAEISRG